MNYIYDRGWRSGDDGRNWVHLSRPGVLKSLDIAYLLERASDTRPDGEIVDGGVFPR